MFTNYYSIQADKKTSGHYRLFVIHTANKGFHNPSNNSNTGYCPVKTTITINISIRDLTKYHKNAGNHN